MLQDILKKKIEGQPRNCADWQLNEKLSDCRYSSMFGRLLTKILLPGGRCRIKNHIVTMAQLFGIELRKLHRSESAMAIKEFMFYSDWKSLETIIKSVQSLQRRRVVAERLNLGSNPHD
jgi:hypothetical protein